MSSNNAEQKQRASVLLGLRMTREEPMFASPTDEELTAMLENRLDTTRAAQIRHSIAHDPAVFSRWMAVVEMAETLHLAGFAKAPGKAASDTPSLISRIKALFSNPLQGLAAGGGLAAAALAVVVVINMPTQYDSGVDQLYDSYGQQWQSLPSQVLPTRSNLTRAQKVELSAADKALKSGIKKGLDRLGDAFVLQQVNDFTDIQDLDSVRSALDTEQYQLLEAVGQAATLSFFKCSLGSNSDYYDATLAYLESTVSKLATYSDSTSELLKETLQRSGDSETRVCRFSKRVVKRVED